VEYLLVCLVFAFWGGYIGRSKGSSFWIWFLVSGFLPFIGIFAAILYRHETDELRRQCPGCGKIVPIYDALCTRCGTELEFPEEAIESETAARSG
jgi:hypothetical protein